MGTVYRARHSALERDVALKLMAPEVANDRSFAARFRREAHAASRLTHPNSVMTIDFGEEPDGLLYLVMEYVRGESLEAMLERGRTLGERRIVDLLSQVLSAVAMAHAAGIVHRDLKPENVMLADDGRIKIGDFGLARAVSANTATGAALLGTIAYLSPELVTRGIADARSDIYAVGIMMYEMLAGEQPFRGEQPMQIAYQHANDSVPTPSTKNPNVPAELDELVLWATAREPAERPRDARIMLEQVVETQSQLQTALPTGATSVIQRTTVMPAALAASGTGDQTQVIRAAQPSGPVVPISDSTAALTTQAGKRRNRAWWWIVLFIVLAGAAGGTGWYFGAGPGSQVTIPSSLVGLAPDAAVAALDEVGLSTADTRDEVFSPTVAVGAVASTDPAAGSSVSRDTVVKLQISKGPQPVDVPEFTGLSEEDAKALATSTGFVPGDSEFQFNADVAAGVVLASYGVGPDGSRITLETGTQYFDQAQVTFLISKGALPNVVGSSVEKAVADLAAVGVTGVPTDPVFDPTIPDGQVISLTPQNADAPVAPGDSVNLAVSKGPDLVEVPDVVGSSITEAKAALEAAEFTVKISTNVPSPFWGQALVKSVKPGDAKLLRGSEITIVANY